MSLRIAQVIRAWSAFGAGAAMAGAVVLEHHCMTFQAVFFFFAYILATQWRERVLEEV